jgi:YD repeat-containing protein
VYTGFRSTWRGTAPPPSVNSVEVYFSALEVDDYGRTTRAKYHNDASRSDDDYCVETKYATPTGTKARMLTVPTSRKVTNCSLETGALLVYAEESFEYDKLMSGLVGSGLVTAHTVYRHATDTGAYLSTVRAFDATYDVSGNPIKVEATREDGATRTTTLQYDGFGVVPTRRTVSGTNIPALDTWMTFDPISGELVATLHANAKTVGATYDGYGRPVLDTIDSGGVHGILVARTYLGFDGDVKGRRVQVKQFTDPVAQLQIASEPGRVTRSSTSSVACRRAKRHWGRITRAR